MARSTCRVRCTGYTNCKKIFKRAAHSAPLSTRCVLRNNKKYMGNVEGKWTDYERMKKESKLLRGTIMEDLNDSLTGGFQVENFFLIRFHGMYQQDDRDIRKERFDKKLEPLHEIMLRCRLPGGVITPKQWLGIDKFAKESTRYGSIRFTNRKTFQFHGILKWNVKYVHKLLQKLDLDSLATAKDVNRNVLCTSNPV